MSVNPYYVPYWSNELEHHGVKGQSWGERNGPPYPLDRGKDGRITKAQKNKKQGIISKLQARKRKKAKVKQLEKARAVKAEKAAETKSKEDLRQQLLNSTDPKFIAQHLDLLDTREIQDRINRINTEKNLRDLAADKNTKKNVDKGMNWINNMSKIAEATSKAAKAYNDVLEASGKKEKLDREKADAKKSSQTTSKTSKKLLELIDQYQEDSKSFEGISMEFDPKTGKVSFKAEKEKKDKKK